VRAKRRGTIIFTDGGLALEPYPSWSSLAAGKAALRAYAIALHKEVAAENIRVAVIAICGIIEPGGLFDPDLLADSYWKVHAIDAGRLRELVYLPAGADPYYNDPKGIYRSVSQPIRAAEPKAIP
jgi:NAD(P)-dependent dehydrogenase (short-subunit alcohol dehydrogenase family)